MTTTSTAHNHQHLDLSQVNERLLVVDDDNTMRLLLSRYLKIFGLEADIAVHGKEAVEMLTQRRYGVLITDMIMPEMDGMALLEHSKKHYPHIDVLVISGHTKVYTFTDLIEAGASDFIGKPFERNELEAKLKRIFRERQLIGQLNEAKLAAEEANREKGDFIHTISHEMRTPMNGIMGFASLLSELDGSEDHESLATYLKMITVSADRLMELVSQILNYAKLEASRQDLQASVIDLSVLLSKVHTTFQAKLKGKGLGYEVKLDPQLPGNLYGDPDVLELILNNLLDNAIKFSDKGSICLSVRVASQQDQLQLVEFALADMGYGIPPEKQEMIFQPFGHAESYKTRRQQGVGLGLSICAKLVQLMDGRIWLDSTEGQGSTFYFEVPLAVG